MKKRNAEVAVLSVGGRAPLSVICTWRRRTSSAVVVSVRARELGKRRDVADIVTAGLLGEFAYCHIHEQAAAKFADGFLAHR
jgi:hypothetical protein